MTERKHKSGFVNIIGNPNVGKSTLMNRLVGERISIITSKAQTTRHRILGIVNTDDMQIVYSDTPGVLRPNYKLQETMRESSESALGDADILLYVTDMVEKTDKNDDFLQQVRGIECPVLLLINKIDLTDQAEIRVAHRAFLLKRLDEGGPLALAGAFQGGPVHGHGLPGFDVVATFLAVPDRRTEARRDRARCGVPGAHGQQGDLVVKVDAFLDDDDTRSRTRVLLGVSPRGRCPPGAGQGWRAGAVSESRS